MTSPKTMYSALGSTTWNEDSEKLDSREAPINNVEMNDKKFLMIFLVDLSFANRVIWSSRLDAING